MADFVKERTFSIVTKCTDFEEMQFDVRGASKENFAQILIFKAHSGDNQKFYLQQHKDGSYKIIAKHSGKALQPAGLQKQDQIVQCDVNSYDNMQDWLLKPMNDGYFIIQNVRTQFVMDIPMDTNSTIIQQLSVHTGDNQRFQFV